MGVERPLQNKTGKSYTLKKKNLNLESRFAPTSELDTFCFLPTVLTQGCFLEIAEIGELQRSSCSCVGGWRVP